MVGLIPRDDDSREDLFNRFMDLWNDVIRHVKESPLFPITHIADIFEVLISSIGRDTRLRTLIDEVDALIPKEPVKGPPQSVHAGVLLLTSTLADMSQPLTSYSRRKWAGLQANI